MSGFKQCPKSTDNFDKKKFLTNGCYKHDVETCADILKHLGINATAALPTARVVRLQRVDGKADYINVSELEIYDESGRRIFEELTPSSSQVWSNNSDGYGPQLLLDGNPNTMFHSLHDANAFVQFNLRTNTKISRIVLRNRSDCCKSRIVGCAIMLLDEQNREVLRLPITSERDVYEFDLRRSSEDDARAALDLIAANTYMSRQPEDETLYNTNECVIPATTLQELGAKECRFGNIDLGRTNQLDNDIMWTEPIGCVISEDQLKRDMPDILSHITTTYNQIVNRTMSQINQGIADNRQQTGTAQTNKATNDGNAATQRSNAANARQRTRENNASFTREFNEENRAEKSGKEFKSIADFNDWINSNMSRDCAQHWVSNTHHCGWQYWTMHRHQTRVNEGRDCPHHNPVWVHRSNGCIGWGPIHVWRLGWHWNWNWWRGWRHEWGWHVATEHGWRWQ